MLDDAMVGAYSGIVELMEAGDTDWGRFQNEHLLARSGESHKRIRDVLAPAFTPRQANIRRQLMREVIEQQLDEWAPKGAFDFELFASFFPITVMCRLIGAPTDAIPELRSSLEALGQSTALDKSKLPVLDKAYQTMEAFAKGLIDDRRRAPRADGESDIIDMLIAAEAEGKISEAEILNVMVFMFVAGYDTSKNMLTLLMNKMIERPDYWERCADDRDFCANAVEEMFRYSSVVNIIRTVTDDIDYDGVHFPKGTMLIFAMTLGARDPNYFDRPDDYDPDRSHTNRHVGLGRGSHICLGQHLAKAQITEAVHQIAQRMRKPRLAGEIVWRPFLGIWGLETLPIEFEPA